ncbi:MAG: hypothetical protein ACKPCP_07200, partial [Sphaerospermopsis kisseleviana]
NFVKSVWVQNCHDVLNSMVQNRILVISTYAKYTILGAIVWCKTVRQKLARLFDLVQTLKTPDTNIRGFIYLTFTIA